MIRRTAVLAAIAATFSTLPCHSQTDSDGFVPLFNGRDLTGWVRENGSEQTFTVRDGMIIDSGLPVGVMHTAKMYENFILEFEWRHMKSGGNSGMFAWSDGLPQPGSPFPRGIEVQVLDPGYALNHKGANEWFTTHGDLFPVGGATMITFGRTSKTGQRSFPIEDRTKPSPEWNHYRLVADRGELRLSVNGKEVTVGKDCVPRKGFLSMEAEGTEVHFRNIRIKELPSSNTPPEQTANAYEGFRPIFDGIGFGGWKVDDRIQSVWTASGSHFRSKPGMKGGAFDLWTEKSYRDFELIADWRYGGKGEKKEMTTFTKDGLIVKDAAGKQTLEEMTHAGDSGIYLRGSSRYQVNIWSRPMGSGNVYGVHVDPKVPAEVRQALVPNINADAPVGKWNRFHITLKGDRLTVVLNDKKVIDNAVLPEIPAEGPIALQYHGDDLEFTNVFLREL